MTKPLPPEKRKTGFWLNVEKLSDEGAGPLGGCWEWRGCLSSGYGMASYRGKKMMAHRAAWVMTFGEIPVGYLVCHKCDNHPCVRPDHLFLGTPRDNMIDMYSKGRGPTGDRNGSKTKPWRRAVGDRNGSRTMPESRPRGDAHWLYNSPELISGEKNPNCKLTDEDIGKIRGLYADGMTQLAIATMFNVTQVHISRIVRGKQRVI
jgi:hypothetical protein